MNILVYDKTDEVMPIYLCGIYLGDVPMELLERYDIETKSHVWNIEGHIRRKLREEFGLGPMSAFEVMVLEQKLCHDTGSGIVAWFVEYMRQCLVGIA